MNENQFETELIQYLTTGRVKNPDHDTKFNENSIAENSLDYVYHSELWKYEPEIKTTEQL
jgi:type I restriction enzyme R subunit